MFFVPSAFLMSPSVMFGFIEISIVDLVGLVNVDLVEVDEDLTILIAIEIAHLL